MYSKEKCLYSVLVSVCGNWRNAIYLQCSRCDRKCGGFLLSTNSDGSPVLFPVSDFEKITGEKIDPNECACVMTRETFEKLFHRWLIWHTAALESCCITEILNNQNEEV